MTFLPETSFPTTKLILDFACLNSLDSISSLISTGQAIENLRSDKTVFHGKTDGDLMITDAMYAYFVINATTSVGLFLLNFYKSNYPPAIKSEEISDDELPL